MRYQAKAKLPTNFGMFQILAYEDKKKLCHLCLAYGELECSVPIHVRVHSKCTTGDAFGSLRCDCGAQLHESMRIVSEAGQGIIIYLEQEGRCIGLLEKIKAYELQDREGLDTIEANLALGQPVDARTYDVAVEILHTLGITDVILLTNNPYKMEVLREAGFSVVRQPLVTGITPYNFDYLETKKMRLGHSIPAELLQQGGEATYATDKL